MLGHVSGGRSDPDTTPSRPPFKLFVAKTMQLVSRSHQSVPFKQRMPKKVKTYNSGYSPVVTHLTTNPPVEGLTCGERTGPSGLLRLWSYVSVNDNVLLYKPGFGHWDIAKPTRAYVISTHDRKRARRSSRQIVETNRLSGQVLNCSLSRAYYFRPLVSNQVV